MNALREILDAARYDVLRVAFEMSDRQFQAHHDPDVLAKDVLASRLGKALLNSGEAVIDRRPDFDSAVQVYKADLYTLRRGDLERIIQAAFDAGLKYQDQRESGLHADHVRVPQRDGSRSTVILHAPLRWRDLEYTA